APYTSWSGAVSLAVDADNSPFDCWMDSAGDIFLVYTKVTTFDLLFRRITFSSGAWTAGAAVTIYSADDCFFPSITFEDPLRLWVTYTRLSGGSYYINAQKSDTWGVTWVAGAGETLSAAGTSAFSQIVVSGNWVYAIFTLSGTKLALKDKHVSISLFNDEQTLASGAGFDEHFHASVAPDGRVGVLYDHGSLRYREYDGTQWLASREIDSVGGEYPRVSFPGNVTLLTYLSSFGTNQNRLLYSSAQGGTFSTPADLSASRSTLASVTAFESSSGTYENLTSQASSAGAADVFHSASGALLKSANDALYLGQSERFSMVQVILSTVGAGGAVAWQYFDGSGWVNVTPVDGAYHLTLGARELAIWNDLDSTPANWQTTTVNGVTGFFIRALVTAAFTTAPIGSQITAVPYTVALVTEA
ncbi:MAG: hypothetical protein ACE5GA_00980, partial [Candidatus Zixiibacteriota bacterium]